MIPSPNTYLIAYDLNASKNYAKLYSLFQLLKAQHLQDSLWSVTYSSSPLKLLQTLKEYGDSDDYFLVIEPKAIYSDPPLFTWDRAVRMLGRSTFR